MKNNAWQSQEESVRLGQIAPAILPYLLHPSASLKKGWFNSANAYLPAEKGHFHPGGSYRSDWAGGCSWNLSRYRNAKGQR